MIIIHENRQLKFYIYREPLFLLREKRGKKKMNGQSEGKKWLLEVAEDKVVHDEYGNTHVISSTWIRGREDMQRCAYHVLIDGKDVTRRVNEIPDKILRKQIKEALGYGKVTIVKTEEME